MKKLLCFALPVIISACGGTSSPDETHTSPRPQFALRAPEASTTMTTFSGSRANYTITKSGSSFTIKDNAGSDGTTVVSSSQSLKFADVTVNLAIGAKTASITEAELQRLIELYIAFFNRVPDADGLAYWIDQYKAGATINQIADSFYSAATQYSSLTGYSSTMSNADFVAVIYKNVLGRSSVDAGGLNYWTAGLASGAESRGSLVSTILSSAHSFKGDSTYGSVANLLDNKYAVGLYFAVKQGLSFNSAEASITTGMQIAAAVTSSDTAAAKALVTAAQGGFDLQSASAPMTAISAVQLQACPNASAATTNSFYTCMTGSITGTTTFGGTACTLTVDTDGTITLASGSTVKSISASSSSGVYSKTSIYSADTFFMVASLTDYNAPVKNFDLKATSPAYSALTGGATSSGIQADLDSLSCKFAL